jgi:hypothetical protein
VVGQLCQETDRAGGPDRARLGSDVGSEPADDAAVSAGVLCRVQGVVGEGDELGNAVGVLGEAGGTDRHGDAHPRGLVGSHGQSGDGLPEPLGQLGQLGAAYPRHEDREFLTAIAGNDVAGTHHLLQAFGDLAEDPVAAGVAIGVVDRLEVVDVEQDQAELLVAASGAIGVKAQLLLQEAAVVELGQPVGDRGMALHSDQARHPAEHEREQSGGTTG